MTKFFAVVYALVSMFGGLAFAVGSVGVWIDPAYAVGPEIGFIGMGAVLVGISGLSTLIELERK